MPSSKIRNLAQPPIREAVIDIRVELPTTATIDKLKQAAENAKVDEQIVKALKNVELTFDTATEASTTMGPLISGYVFTNPDRTRVIQFRMDGFTFSWLGEYKDWNSLIDEADRWWKVYCAAISPEKVVRIATRFINRFDFPGSDLHPFLTRPPLRPVGVAGDLSSFFYRVRVDAGDDISSIITQTTEVEKHDDKLPFYFDIDVSKRVELLPNELILGSHFAPLREIKNDVFFDSFTDKALKLCEN